MRIFSLYAGLLCRPGVPALATCSALTRISSGASTMALILFAYSLTHSFAEAGLVATASGFGYALGTPYEGRLIDRVGARPVLIPMGLLWGLVTICYLLLLGERQSLWLVVPLAFVAGVFTPSTSGAMRAIWRRVAKDEKERE